MHRHILDTPRDPAGTQRMMRYLGLERGTRPAAATLYLQKRARKGTMRPVLKRYLRMERGQTA